MVLQGGRRGRSSVQGIHTGHCRMPYPDILQGSLARGMTPPWSLLSSRTQHHFGVRSSKARLSWYPALLPLRLSPVAAST